MLDLIRSIAESIIRGINFLQSIVDSFIDLFTHIPVYITFLTNNITMLPQIIIPFAVASIYIYIVFLLIDRGIN